MATSNGFPEKVVQDDAQNDIANDEMSQAMTITFGEVAENHIGQQKIGQETEGNVTEGLSEDLLQEIKEIFDTIDATTELVDLCDLIKGTEIEHHEAMEPAHVLIIRNGATHILQKIGLSADDMYKEHVDLPKDSKYYDTRRSKVLNKIARHNLCFDDVDQEADYDNKKGTIVSFERIACTRFIREQLAMVVNMKTETLKAEGNYYYDPKKCGIGFHGDTERKIVIAVRLGVSIPLHYQWYYKTEPIGQRCELELSHGDMYFMSEKAVGNDWKRRIIPTLRHAAGADKYLNLPKGSRSKRSSRAKVSTPNSTSSEMIDQHDKVANPLTGRMITVGKGVYNGLVKKGYVLQNGVMVLGGDGEQNGKQ